MLFQIYISRKKTKDKLDNELDIDIYDIYNLNENERELINSKFLKCN